MSNVKEPILAKVLRYFIYAVAFVPLIIFSEYMSPFHFGKVVVLRSLIEFMAVFYILLAWQDKAYRPKLNKIGWAFFFFACAFTISTITSVIPYASFWGSLERMGGAFSFWHYFVFFVIMTSVLKKEEDWLKLLNLTIFIGILSAFYGFLQKTDLEWVVGGQGRSRIFGTIGNPALFAGYQIVCLFLALTLFFKEKVTLNFRIFYGVAVVINTIAVLMTAVRGSILGISVSFLCFALLYSSVYKSRRAKNYLLYLVTIFVILVGLALLFRDSSFIRNSRYLTRLTDFSLTTYTVQTRFWAWESGIEGWSETPKTVLLGWGPENFNIPFSRYFNPLFYAGPGAETLFDRAHNMFVEIIVTMGLLGFITYIWIFISSIKVLWKKTKSKEYAIYGIGLIPLLIAYAIHNSFIFDTSANFIVFFITLGFISFLDQPKQEVISRPVKINKSLWTLVGVIMFIFASVFVYNINIIPAKANYTTTRGIVLGWSGNFTGAVAQYQEALEYDVPGKYEIRHRFAQYVLETTQSKSDISQDERDAILFAIDEIEKNRVENEVDYLPYLYKSRLYITLGKGDPQSEYNDKSLEMSAAALELSPTFVRAYYEVGQAYLNKRDYVKAAEAFKKAAELNPEVGLSQWYYGVVEVEKGNIDLGLSIIERVIADGSYVPAANDMNRLISLYLAKNDFGKLVWAYEILVESNPNNAQYNASLAVAYANIGRIDDAVKYAKRAAELDKEYESEARSFVQSLGRSW